MPRIYATPADLSSWTDDVAPPNAAVLLRYASTLVEGATSHAHYRVDADGYPTGQTVSGAFESATCAQASFWAANGLDPAKGNLGVTGERVATSKAIRGATVSYDSADAAQGKQARIEALRTLSTEAYQVLSNEGLTPGVIR